MSKLRAKVIVNPAAGAGTTYKKWSLISGLMKSTGLAFDCQFTEGRGHGIELAREAAGAGYNFLVAVGGDGTIHEVANGLIDLPREENATLGIVSTGTGSDLARSIGIDHNVARACSRLTSEKRLRIDVGAVEYSLNEERRKRYFVNSAGMGFDATVVRATEQLPKFWGGTIPYLLGLARSFFGYTNKTVTIRIGDMVQKVRVVSVVVANGGYFGGGMHVAPGARLDDSWLDAVVVGNFGKIELLRTFPRVYKGTHLDHPKIKMQQVKRISVESTQKMLLHADGELLGEGPATFEILPGALNLVV
jgi:diacylglycerol kinase (ATP)